MDRISGFMDSLIHFQFQLIATNRRQDEQDLQDGFGFCLGSVTVKCGDPFEQGRF
jgi:hypothetical protein